MTANREVTVQFQPIGRRVQVDWQATLLDAARQAGIALTSTCGGEGNCGQCRIQVVSGEVTPLTEDEIDVDTNAYTRMIECHFTNTVDI